MYPIAVYQLSGLAGAVMLHAPLIACARRWGGSYWPFAYLFGLALLGAMLTWQALVPLPFLVPATCVVLAGMGGVAAWQLGAGRDGEPKSSARDDTAEAPTRAAKILDRTAMAFLALDLLWAAFPAYRYDQWNYHLMIPKVLAALGKLPRPIFYDHVYFTGVYEYVLTIPRFFWGQDTFNACFADSSTWIAYTVSLYGLLRFAAERFRWRTATPFLLLAAIFFATPEHQSLTNAKPDLLLTPMALACLVLVEESWREPGRRSSFWLGVMLALPLAIKVIWLQFLAAIGIAGAAAWVRRRLRVDLPGMAAGAVLGVLCAVPPFVKNFIFFHNPLHPAQLAFFRTVPWVPASEHHWGPETTGRATSIAQFFDILGAVPWQYLRLNAWFLPVPVVVLAVWWRQKRRSNQGAPAVPSLPTLRSWPLLLGALAVFMLMWPAFFDPRFQPRYIDTVFAIAIMVVAFAAARMPKGPKSGALLSVALAVPLFGNSAADVKARKMAQGMGRMHDDFYNKPGKEPLDLYRFSTLINDHRRRTFPGATMPEHIVLSDTPSLYFLGSLNQRVGQADWDIVYGEYLEHGGAPCLWGFLRYLRVNYVFSYEQPFTKWPEPLQALFDQDGKIPGAEPLTPDDTIYYLPEALIDRRIAATPACGHG